MARKCKSCKEPIVNARSSLQDACSPKCALKLVQKNREKEKRKWVREAKRKLKTLSDWLGEAQVECNKYIRLRDKGEPCISCGRYHKGQVHAGHYRSVGACPELRFHPFNINLQCSACNAHLSGNIVEYRIRLIEKIGEDAVKWLEGPHEPQRYRIEDAQEIKQYFRGLVKELED